MRVATDQDDLIIARDTVDRSGHITQHMALLYEAQGTGCCCMVTLLLTGQNTIGNNQIKNEN